MALDARTHQQIYNEVFGRTDYEPLVTFYDHATYNEELSKQSGRPRFVEVTYTMLKPTHPDLKVRDVVSHRTTEEEKVRYAKQWEAYLKTKQEQREFKPPLQAIPGMRISLFKELQALEIYDAEGLAKCEKDLGEFNHMKALAKRIMEVSDEARNLYERRGNVGEAGDRQPHGSTPESRGETVTRPPPHQVKYTWKDGGLVYTETPKEEETTFSYSFQV